MATEVRMPQLGLTMEEGTVTKWLKSEGDQVSVGEVIAEITTDKLTTQLESESSGVILKIYAKIGQDIPVKGLLCVVGQAGEVHEVYDQDSTISNEVTSIKATGNISNNLIKDLYKEESKRIKISPLAKKTASKHMVDFTLLNGTGPGGRIIQKDILNALETTKVEKNKTEEVLYEVKPSNNLKVELMDGDLVDLMTGMRKIVSERMTRAHSEIPSVTQTMKINVTELLKFRKELNDNREVKFTINDLILKAVAKSLKENSGVLVSIDGDRIIRRAHVNIGMAVALDDGLIVPVIRDADKLSLTEISIKSRELSTKARTGKLSLDEYSGSTFTISNMGMLGIESFTPIINQPDSAILGVNEIQSELDMDDLGNVYKKQVMRVSMTYDHRLMDGAVAAKFKISLRELLENPMEIVL